jgi:hypothetical protein
MSFREYVEHGWVLCPIREGEKRPRGAGWNLRYTRPRQSI